MGISFDETIDQFVFDFKHDGQSDIITLTGEGYQVEAFGQCFHYGYEFSDTVDGDIRSRFIKFLKFTPELENHPDITRFIQRAIDNLGKHINLYEYDLVVMPESSSKVNQYMLRYLYRFAQPMMRYMELVKALPEKVQFDTDGYFKDEEDRDLWKAIQSQNVLIVDDITTSGSTLNEILRALRVVNDSNKITVFSLLGRKDLMAEKW